MLVLYFHRRSLLEVNKTLQVYVSPKNARNRALGAENAHTYGHGDANGGMAIGGKRLWEAGADHGGHGVDTPAHRRCGAKGRHAGGGVQPALSGPAVRPRDGAALQPSPLLRPVPDGGVYAGRSAGVGGGVE